MVSAIIMNKAEGKIQDGRVIKAMLASFCDPIKITTKL